MASVNEVTLETTLVNLNPQFACPKHGPTFRTMTFFWNDDRTKHTWTPAVTYCLECLSEHLDAVGVSRCLPVDAEVGQS